MLCPSQIPSPGQEFGQLPQACRLGGGGGGDSSAWN